MRKKKTGPVFTGTIALICSAMFLWACTNPSGGGGTVPVTGISLDKTTLTLAPGGTAVLTVSYTPADTTQTGVTWSSSAESVATVSDGTVSAVALGTAVITATSTADPSVKAVCAVAVTATGSVPLTGISLDKSTLDLAPNGTAVLTVIYDPADTTEKDVTWSSSDPAIATVSDGTVSAVALGTATITATSTADSTITATCAVTVRDPVPLTGISLDRPTLNLAVGGTTTLVVIYNPGNTTQKGVTWSSGNTSVATVSDGTVTAVAVGTATITATSTADSTKKAECTVTVVSQAVPLTGISLDQSTLNLAVDTRTTLTVIYSPDNTTQTGVTWSSSDPAKAAVDAVTGQITAVAVGTATITATSTADRTKTIACTVTVVAEEIPLTGIGLSETTLTMSKGGTETITVSYTPANTTQTGVTWSTSDSAVATVSNGTIRAVGGGTARITATSTANPARTATCTVNVAVPLSGISLPATFTIVRTLTGSIPVTYTPADTTQKGVTWSSGNTSVATVSDGTVTAVAVGTAVITATSTADSTKTATCTVTVREPRHGINITVTFTGFEDETIDLGVVKPEEPDPGPGGDSGSGGNTVSDLGGDSGSGGVSPNPDPTPHFVIKAPEGFDRYLWYVNGNYFFGLGESSWTVYPEYILPGYHYITVIVEKSDGSHFSKTVKYTVGY
jgi:uncharacterized protein YjdB